MNRTDRLLAIILELQGKQVQRAQDLAATFETSMRTIYRDMQALSEAGVPIIASPGQGYSLVEGYFLPPVSLTAKEAMTVLLGIEFIKQQFDVDYKENASAAEKKIEAILPEVVRNEVERLRASMKLATSSPGLQGHSDMLAALRGAVIEKRVVCFHYIKTGGHNDVRKVNPYGLEFVNGAWLLIAHCHLRNAMRHFLLRRMSSLCVLDEIFCTPPDFDLHTYSPPDERNVIVRMLFRPELAMKLKEYHYYFVETIEDNDDGLLVTLKIRHLQQIIDWVLGWGEGAVVLEPEALRHMIKQEVEKIMKRY